MGGCMTWRAEDPEGYESSKIASLAVPYLQGKCLDLGCGLDVVWPSVIGVDNGDHFGERSAGIKCDVTNLSLFSSGSMDAVFSSHVLEHFEREDVPTILGEWWRVIRKGGFLVLYLPHKDLYPNIGEPGSNPTHKWDILPEDIIDIMKGVGSWTMKENEVRSGTNE